MSDSNPSTDNTVPATELPQNHSDQPSPRRMTRRRALLLLGLGVPAAVAIGAWRVLGSGRTGEPALGTAEPGRPAGWTAESHGDGAKPNYAVVFPTDKVNEIKVTIAPADWQAMQANMTELLGNPGTERGGAPGAVAKPEGGQAPGPGGMGGGIMDMTPVNPMWVPSTVEFGGNKWTKVGIRYKGNSSLSQGWRSGSKKLPLKLDFDQFEGENPEILNQRFYGFKQLSLANGFGDSTYLREALAYDLLADAGLVAAKTSYANITVEYGEGPVDLGIYTVVEVIDDTVVARTYGSDKGNIYQGDGSAASLAAGTSGQIMTSFQKGNNKQEADWSDVEGLYNVLHSSERTSNAAAWRAKLEAAFDVDAFLKWLGLAAVLQHWDSYGSMSHNYYLYHNPANDKLTWISWDHNLILGANIGLGDALGDGGGLPEGMPALPFGIAKPEGLPAGRAGAPGIGPGGPGGMGGMGSVSLDKVEVGTGWPLIRFLLDDPTYGAKYVGFLKEIGRDLFVPEKLAARSQKRAAIVGPYAAKTGGQAQYDAAVQSLNATIEERARVLAEFVATR